MDHQIVVNGKTHKHKFQVNHIGVVGAVFTINQQHQEDEDEDQHKDYVHVMKHRLKFKTQRMQRSQGCPCIFKFIGNLGGDYQCPRVVSIGPYHRGNDYLVEFDDNKWHFLKKLLLRMSANSNKDLGFFLKEMRVLEACTRGCYASHGDVGLICSYDFVEMMLLDGCFIIELFRFLGKSEDGTSYKDDSPIFVRPFMVPLMLADILKLENQLPFFVLESLFTVTRTPKHEKELLPLFMEVIKSVFPVPTRVSISIHPPKHLLDLVHKFLMPETYTTHTNNEKKNKHTSNETIQCATRLSTSGIKFKSVGLLDIKFKTGVLEIPIVNITDFNMNLITNCLGWEQSGRDTLTYFTDYIYFINCLINGPEDVTLLRDNGIIMRHSRDDASVVSFFHGLGKNIQAFNIERSYLSREMREIESYYSSNWATMMRTLSIHN